MDLVDTFVNLLDVFVDGHWILSLTDDFKQVIVREEEETREFELLPVQEVIQLLCNFVDCDVA